MLGSKDMIIFDNTIIVIFYIILYYALLLHLRLSLQHFRALYSEVFINYHNFISAMMTLLIIHVSPSRGAWLGFHLRTNYK